jgi:hypothetical protein
VTDYRRFLGTAATSEVLPYFGGPFVEAVERRLRLAAPVPPGFWRFAVSGRTARAVEPAPPPDLSGLPAVRGYALPAAGGGYLVHGSRGERFALPPLDEPLPFAALVARRWPSGELLPDAPDFETGVEDEVRRAYDGRQPLTGVRGVPADLRAAYGYAVLLRLAGELGVPARPAEARPHLGALAAGGDGAARRILLGFREVRAAQPVPEWQRRRETALARRTDGAEERVAASLRAADAALRGTRWLAGGLLEVRYDLEGEQFVSIVDAQTFTVADAGICLIGHDRQLTLDSLPGVIREAMRTDQLHVTAW